MADDSTWRMLNELLAQSHGVQWEIAKGHLRACVSQAGNVYSTALPKEQGEAARKKHDDFERAVEKFIKQVEGAGWHE